MLGLYLPWLGAAPRVVWPLACCAVVFSVGRLAVAALAGLRCAARARRLATV